MYLAVLTYTDKDDILKMESRPFNTLQDALNYVTDCDQYREGCMILKAEIIRM